MSASPQHAPRSAWAPVLALVAAFLGLGLALNLLVGALSPPGYDQTALDHAWATLKGAGGDDSWGTMKYALDRIGSALPPVYTEVFFKRGIRFQYPPSSLFVLDAMLALAPQRVQLADEYTGPWPAITSMLGWASLAALAAATAALAWLRLRRRGSIRPGLLPGAALALATLGLCLTFYPVVKSFTLGQIQFLLNAMLAGALLLWAFAHKRSAGLLVGLACLVKPHYGLIVLWALLRREWSFAATAAATAAAGLAASIVAYGFHNHVDYAGVLSYLSRHGETFYPNQSMNGLLNRVAAIWDPVNFKVLDFVEGHFPPFRPWIYGIVLASSLAIVALALFRRPRGDTVRDFAIIVLSCTIASPIAWEHHYGVLFAIFGLLFAEAWPDRRRLALVALSYALVGTFVQVANLAAATPFNPVISHLYFGALLALALLHIGPKRAPAAATP